MTVRTRNAWLLVALLVRPALAAPLDDVLEADRAFARHAAQHGAQAAFVEYAAPDALMFRAGIGPVRGRAAIGEVFAGSTAQAAWAPEGGDIAASGDLAWTWGYFTWTPKEGQPLTGNYVSVWRRIDGRWRWVVDLGVPGPPRP
jgi:ketosteroid isomerase-like protein